VALALDRLLDLFALVSLCFSSTSFCFRYSYAQQTLVSYLVNLWAHYKTVID